MNKYIAFYNGEQKEIEAASSYAAQQKAVADFKAPKSKRHMVHVLLAEEQAGEPVVHSTASIG